MSYASQILPYLQYQNQQPCFQPQSGPCCTQKTVEIETCCQPCCKPKKRKCCPPPCQIAPVLDCDCCVETCCEKKVCCPPKKCCEPVCCETKVCCEPCCRPKKKSCCRPKKKRCECQVTVKVDPTPQIPCDTCQYPWAQGYPYYLRSW